MIPFLENFCAEALRPGLCSLYYEFGAGRGANFFCFQFIKEHLALSPNKKVVVALEDEHWGRELTAYTLEYNLDNSKIIRITHLDELLVLDKGDLSALILANAQILDTPMGTLGAKGRLLRRLITHFSELPLLYASPIRRIHSTPWSSIPQGEGMNAHAILQFTTHPGIYDQLNVKILKCRSTHNYKTIEFPYTIENRELKSLLKPMEISEQKNFYNFKMEGAYLVSEPVPLPEALTKRTPENIEELFSDFKTSKAVKKAIVEKSIKATPYLTHGVTLVQFNHAPIIRYLLAKYIYQENFDPNFFLNYLKTSSPPLIITNLEDFLEGFKTLAQLVTQKQIYEWFSFTHEVIHTLNIIKSLKQKNLPIALPKGLKKIKEIHNYLSDYLFVNDPNNLTQVNTSAKAEWHNTTHRISLNQTAQEITLYLPTQAQHFKRIGREMGLCVQNEWFWKQLQEKNESLIFLSQDKELKYCVHFNEERHIIEARGVYNQRLSEEMLLQLSLLVEDLP